MILLLDFSLSFFEGLSYAVYRCSFDFFSMASVVCLTVAFFTFFSDASVLCSLPLQFSLSFLWLLSYV